MYHFQSLFNLTIPGTPEIKFANGEFSTDDEAVANRLRKNSKFGQDLWEVEPEILQEQARDAMAKLAPLKRRGRPPKVQVITGKITTDQKEKEG